LGLHKAIGEVWRLIEGVKTKLNETDDAVGLVEAKDRVKSDVAGLGAVMVDRRAKVEEVRRGAASLKANQDMTNLKQELGKLKKEMRELQVLNAVMAPQQLRYEQEICHLKHEM
jgi:hypothetical protein